MRKKLNSKCAMEELQKGYQKADTLLKDDAKMDTFLEKVEKRLKWIPFIRQELKLIPIFISMIRSYLKKGNIFLLLIVASPTILVVASRNVTIYCFRQLKE